MLGYQRRSDPATVEAKRTVDAWKSSGELGRLRYLRICYTDGDWTGNAHGLIDVGEQPHRFPPRSRRPSSPPTTRPAGRLDRRRRARPSAQPAPSLRRRALPARLRSRLGTSLRVRERVGSPDDDRGIAVPGVGRVRRGAPRRVRAWVCAAMPCAVAGGESRGPRRDLLRRGRRAAATGRAGASVDRSAAGAGRELPPRLPGEASPPTDAAEAAEDLHLVADIVRARVALPGAREALRADREERARAWEERRRAMTAAT